MASPSSHLDLSSTYPPLSPDNPSPPDTPKLKGHQRLVKGLCSGFRRISSSSSLPRIGRTPSAVYKTTTSCVSLSIHDDCPSPTSVDVPSLDSSLSSPISQYPSTAATTPNLQVIAAEWTVTDNGLEFLTRRNPADEPHKPFRQWNHLPWEIRSRIFAFLSPKTLVRYSAVSKEWHRQCLDGQIWSDLDTSSFYRDIPAEALVRLINTTGPFLRTLNLRGCHQLQKCWPHFNLPQLEHLCLEQCAFHRPTIHDFLIHGARLLSLDLVGLDNVTNSTLRLISRECPRLSYLNVSWCHYVDTRGLRRVIEACPSLRYLLAAAVHGWDNVEVMHLLFEHNTLETLMLMHCETLTDDALRTLMIGKDPKIDILTGKPMVAPRLLSKLDLRQCHALTDKGLRHCVDHVPFLRTLQLSGCIELTDAALLELIPGLTNLTHLDLDDLTQITNLVLVALSESRCASKLVHLNLSSCEELSDRGVLPIFEKCRAIKVVELDNTRVSDLACVAAAALIKSRSMPTTDPNCKPVIGLRMSTYDCPHVTFTGVREILFRNAEVRTRQAPFITTTTSSSISTIAPLTSALASSAAFQPPCLFPTQIIKLQCLYTFQPTVDEHTKRVLSGDFASANRLERKWAGHMIATEELRISPGARRRRRRAQRVLTAGNIEGAAAIVAAVIADTVDGPDLVGVEGSGERRTGLWRARSQGCIVM